MAVSLIFCCFHSWQGVAHNMVLFRKTSLSMMIRWISVLNVDVECSMFSESSLVIDGGWSELT